jgi:hypothetical protein
MSNTLFLLSSGYEASYYFTPCLLFSFESIISVYFSLPLNVCGSDFLPTRNCTAWYYGKNMDFRNHVDLDSNLTSANILLIDLQQITYLSKTQILHLPDGENVYLLRVVVTKDKHIHNIWHSAARIVYIQKI